MPARIAILGDAVVSAINAATITDCPTAERVASSRYDTAEDGAFKVDVVFGDARTFERYTRGTWIDRPTIDVQIYHKVISSGGVLTPAAMKAEGDRIAALGEGIVDALCAVERLGEFKLLVPSFEGVIIDEWVRSYGVVGSVASFSYENR